MPAPALLPYNNAWGARFWAAFTACGIVLLIAVPLLNLWTPSNAPPLLFRTT